MYREITVGTQSIPMKATASTPIRYRMVFNQDLISEFQSIESDASLAIDTISKLAFIMASAADPSVDMSALNMEKYMNWLEQFEPFDLTNASDQIVDVYMGNMGTKSEDKKKARGAVNDN
jgi:hypothetical protein